ncbi:MAG: amidohydrolase family protein [Planctomycetota bacterium]
MNSMLALAAAVGAAVSASVAGPLGSGRVTAITNANIVSMDGDGVLEDHTVLLREGKIAAVGPSDLVVPPDGAQVIDADGLWMIPGLSDMHVHWNGPHYGRVLVGHGVTNARNLWGFPGHIELREKALAAPDLDDPLPSLTTAGPIVDGDPPVWPGSTGVADTEAARAAVREQVAAGYDFIKVYSRLSREAFLAITDECAALGVRFGGHVPQSVSLEEALDAGMWSIEHLTEYQPALQGPGSPLNQMDDSERRRLNYWQHGVLLAAGVDDAMMAEVGRMTVASGVWNVPTLIVNRRLSASPETKAELMGAEPMRYISPGVRSFWDPSNDFRLQNVDPADLKRAEENFGVYLRIVRGLHEAGVEFVAGSDTPNPFVFPGYSLHEELELLVEAGLSPYQAIRAATVNPSRMLKQKGEFGRVGPGHRGDLVLLRRNPLEDITATREIEGVVLRGEHFDRAALDAMLDRAAEMAETAQMPGGN